MILHMPFGFLERFIGHWNILCPYVQICILYPRTLISLEILSTWIADYSGGHAVMVGSVLVTNLKSGFRKGEWDQVEVPLLCETLCNYWVSPARNMLQYLWLTLVICCRSITYPKNFRIKAWFLLFLFKTSTYDVVPVLWQKVTKIKKMKKEWCYILASYHNVLMTLQGFSNVRVKLTRYAIYLRNVCLLSSSHRSNFWIYLLLFHC